jgi:hypothetical protein
VVVEVVVVEVVVVVKGIGVKFTGFEMQIAGNLVVPS